MQFRLWCAHFNVDLQYNNYSTSKCWLNQPLLACNIYTLERRFQRSFRRAIFTDMGNTVTEFLPIDPWIFLGPNLIMFFEIKDLERWKSVMWPSVSCKTVSEIDLLRRYDQHLIVEFSWNGLLHFLRLRLKFKGNTTWRHWYGKNR